MRIYLLNPPFTPRFGRAARWQASGRAGTLYYPIWLSYATGVLEQKYEQVRLVDAPAWSWTLNEVIDDIEKFDPDLIVVDSSFPSLNNDIQVAEAVKNRLPKAKTVIVGPPVSQLAERILKNEAIDIVAGFEYDFTIRDIAEAMQKGENLSDIKGISYKESGKITDNPPREVTTSEDLDQIPFVSKVYKKHLNIKDYLLSNSLYPEVQIFTGRGCPNFCTFCSWPETLMGREYRVRSIMNVVDELEYIKEELPEVREIFLEDDTFTIKQDRIRAFCEEVARRKLGIIWACNARANLDSETLKAMKAAGCRLLIVGYESGSDEILRNIRKGVTTERMHRFARDARKAGLMVLGDFIFGLPGETKETAEKTMSFAKELKPNIVQFAISTPIPGTKFYEWAQQEGYLLVDDLAEALDKRGFQKAVVSYPDFSSKDIERYVDKALRKYYLSLSYIPVFLRNTLRKNGLHELKATLISARAFLRYLRKQNSGDEVVSPIPQDAKAYHVIHKLLFRLPPPRLLAIIATILFATERFYAMKLRPALGLHGSEKYFAYSWVFDNIQLGKGPVLDVGCGDSLLPYQLAKRGYDTYAVDYFRYWRVAEHDRLHFVKTDISSTPFSSGTFQRILAVSTLEHIPHSEIELTVREIERILADGGLVLVTMPMRESAKEMQKALTQQFECLKKEYFTLHDRQRRWKLISEEETINKDNVDAYVVHLLLAKKLNR